MNKKIHYSILSMLFLIFSIFFFILTLNNIEIIKWLLPLITLTIIVFTVSYINPKIGNDERAKEIRRKAVYVSFYFLLMYIVVASGVLYLGDFQADFQVIFTIITSLTVITLCLNLLLIERAY